MNVPLVIGIVAANLDSQRYDYRPATDKQVVAVNIVLRQHAGKGKFRDLRRYELLQSLLGLGETPETTKIMTMGQAGAIIALARHHEYATHLNEFLAETARRNN